MALSRRLLFLFVFIILAQGCERNQSSSAPPVAAPRARNAVPAESTAWRFPATGRLVAIGDLHGDLAATRAVLLLAGAIDDENRWVGGDLTVVQTGDLLDRGNEERQILELFARLKTEAEHVDGRIIMLNGNHEVMNVQGDFRYVTLKGYEGWENLTNRSPYVRRVRDFHRNRAAALLPGGQFARLLSTQKIIAVVGSTVFAHAGVLPKHLEAGVESINREMSSWMRGERQAPAMAFMLDAPYWLRQYGAEQVTPEVCARLDEVLTGLDAKRMVVGHSIQKTGITSACDGRLYRIDVGLAKFYGSGPAQILQINDEKVSVLSAS